MRNLSRVCVLCFTLGTATAFAQFPKVEARVATQMDPRGKVVIVEVAPRFVTAIRLPEVVNSVVVGDPSAFQVEHSEHEPKLVFVKTLSTKPSETNLLISTADGREVSLLLISRGGSESPNPIRVDFLLKYEVSKSFLIAPSAFPFASVGATVSLAEASDAEDKKGDRTARSADGTAAKFSSVGGPLPVSSGSPSDGTRVGELEQLVQSQEQAPLPVLYGQRVGEQAENGDQVRAGVSRVLDGGQRVVVLFSVLNPTKHAVLLMPPQVQLAGGITSGNLVRHTKWSTAEQLRVLDFRLNRRRLGPSERADGVVVFERPPYKQSNETLLLQVAESGAIDRPALAPIGFGVNTGREAQNDRRE